jgi:hypothetical protein
MPLYIGYFCLGIYAYARGWFSHDGYRPHLGRWAVVWLISGQLYLADRLVVLPAFPSPTAAVQLLHAALFNTFCFSSLMAGMTLFQRKVNAHNAFWRSLGTTSYAIYYIHPLILYPLAYVFVAVSMPLFIKALVVILTGIFLSWLVSALVLTRVPVVRRAFS